MGRPVRRITVDTNVLVRALVGDDPAQAEAATAALLHAEQICVAMPSLVNLEALSRREALEPLEELLTLVVRPEGELAPVSRALVEQQPELSGLIATMLWKRLPHLSLEEVMTIAGIQLAELSETRAYQDILAKGREEGREEGLEQGLEKGGQREAGVLVLKQLRRRFGSVSANDAATIGGLRTAALEDLAEALLAFGSPVDLKAWLANHRGD
jgi:hypothetical protein